MSQEALFLITDEETLRDACQGWMPPLDRPRSKKHENPFTGEISEVKTRVPEELDQDHGEPTIEEIEAGLEYRVLDRLSKAQPLCIEFTVPRTMHDVLKSSPPFLYGGVHGELHQIKRVERDKENEMLQYFGNQAGPWIDEQRRRAKGLSLFVYIFSY
jgi:hypothetical protein